MDLDFVKKLDRARRNAGVPFNINSGYRCPLHNESKEVGGKPDSAHIYGVAADIQAKHSRPRFKILKSLFAVGFHRIGIAKTFIHVDDDITKDPEVVWLY